MSKTMKGIQYFLGVFFILFGLNGLTMIITGSGFIPMPPPSKAFAPIMMGIFNAKFILPIAKVIQLGAGTLLLINRYSLLALILLAPIIFSILMAHLVVGDWGGLPLGLIAFSCWSLLVYKNKVDLAIILRK